MIKYFRLILILILLLLFINISAYTQRYYLYDNLNLNSKIISLQADKDFIYAGCKNGFLFKYNIQSKNTTSYKIHNDKINSISLNDKFIVTSSSDGYVKVLNSKRLDLIREIKTTANTIPVLIFKDSIILFGNDDGYVFKTDVYNTKIDTIFSNLSDKYHYRVTDIIYNQEVNEILICSGDIFVVDDKSFKFKKRIESKIDDFSRIVVSNNKLCVWSYTQKKLIYFNNYNYDYKDDLINSKRSYASPIYFLNSNTIISGLDSTSVIYNLKTSEKYKVLQHQDIVISICKTPDNSFIADAGFDGVVNVYKYSKYEIHRFTTNNINCNTKFSLPNMHFEAGKNIFLDTLLAFMDIDTLINFVEVHKNFKHLLLYGYTDVNAKYSLSSDRVTMVKKILINKGLDEDKILAIGMGVSPNIDSLNREKNRRVDFEVICNSKKLTEFEILKKFLVEFKNAKDTNIIDTLSLESSTTVNILINNKIKKVKFSNTDIQIVAKYKKFYFFVIPSLVAGYQKPYLYSKIKDGKILIKRSVNARIDDKFKYPKIGNKILSVGDKFNLFEKKEINKKNWYKFYIWGYLVKE